MRSLRIERYRTEIRNMDYTPLDECDLQELRDFYRSDGFRNATGIGVLPEAIDLMDMFLEEKVPPDLSYQFILRYVKEEVFANHAGRGYR